MPTDAGLQMQAAAHVMARAAACQAEMEGMKAENARREQQNLAPAYNENDFFALVDKWQLGYNDVQGEFNRANEWYPPTS